MKTKLVALITKYIKTWWIPTAIFLVPVVVIASINRANWQPSIEIVNVLLAILVLAYLGVLLAAIANFIQRCWARGVTNLIVFLVCGFIALITIAPLYVAQVGFSSDDNFADDLVIPDNIEIVAPLNMSDRASGLSEDTFQHALLTALALPGSNDSTITANLTNLAIVQETSPENLRRYLATHPAWRVFSEYGNMFATRRWMIGPEWQYVLHGYYTKWDIDPWSETDIPYFQTRFTIGLSGHTWAEATEDTTHINHGDTEPLKLSRGNDMFESRALVYVDDLVVDVFEQSDTRERRLTKAALVHLNGELAPLVDRPTWQTIHENLPLDSIKSGDASLDLINSSQPGIYDAIVWANPGESGMLYLKAFELTQVAPLSVERLKQKTSEWIGWSDNPSELFLSNTHFTIYEGDWGQPYAARFEVWFAPDSGAPERKLLEKVFKIEGWQR